MRILIVDDERPARDKLRRLLEQEPGITAIEEARDGVEAIERVASFAPDAIFLDVQMPEVSGLEVAASLPDPAPLLVFATAYDEYAVRAFDANAIDYLLKPFDQARLQRALQRLRKRHEARQAPPAALADSNAITQTRNAAGDGAAVPASGSGDEQRVPDDAAAVPASGDGHEPRALADASAVPASGSGNEQRVPDDASAVPASGSGNEQRVPDDAAAVPASGSGHGQRGLADAAAVSAGERAVPLARGTGLPPPQQLMVTERGVTRIVRVADIQWLETADNYVILHTSTGSPLLRQTLAGLLETLGPGFQRCHRRAAVQLQWIERIEATPKGDGEVLLRGGARAPLSRQFRHPLLAALG